MRFGFVIDQRKCIGCHACTVACKAENSVPLGNFRTWVKYVESGQFPDTERHFAVLRCNHCDNAPCVKICPVTALFTRPDGIVDFDQHQCIGCKACMQACPYDAIYVNPATNTTEKCNYCAHRVEVGLLPACVIVCPEQAIIAGDLDNQGSPISQLLKQEKGVPRKPEQATRPKLYYIGSHKTAIRPELQQRGKSYMWAETGNKEEMNVSDIDLQAFIAKAKERTARTAYDVPHAQPWGWKVSAYLWTKSIAAGAYLLPAVGLLLGMVNAQALIIGTIFSLIFQGLTGVLLVADLKRPDRFLRILLRPQWKSWLAIGAYILMFFGGISSLTLLAGLAEQEQLLKLLAIPGSLLAIFAAIYSSFLFAQAEGRDFWQSKITLPHLFAQAVVAGTATFGLFQAFTYNPTLPDKLLRAGFIGGLVLHLICMLLETIFNKSEGGRHPDAARAAELLSSGPFKEIFWGIAVLFGAIVPLAMLITPTLVIPASMFALLGLITYEALWIKVGQAIPLS